MRLLPRLALLVLLALAAHSAAAPAAEAHHGATTPVAPLPWWSDEDEDEDDDEDAPIEEEVPPSGEQDAGDARGVDGLLPPPPATPPRGQDPTALPVVTGRLVPGTRARLRADGRAAVPRGAPKRVRRLIAAINEIVGKPYVWGGGHARLVDRGYDCSGAVSYGLVRTGALRAPLVSGGLARWGSRGAGRWVTVFANRGHVYLEVAGLRLDTSRVGDPRGGRGPRWRPVIGRRPGFAARHPAGL